MISPNFDQFSKLAQHGNFVPVYQELVADLETPVSAWYKVCAGQPYNFLLESVEGEEKLGRYSFLGCDPMWVLEARGAKTTQTHREGNITEYEGNPFDICNECLATIKPVKLPELPPGIGGLFGVWGYELIRWIEPRVPVNEPKLDDLPDGVWMQVDNLIIFDQVKRKIWAISYADLRNPDITLEQAYQDASDRVSKLMLKLQLPLPIEAKALSWKASRNMSDDSGIVYCSNTDKELYCDNVNKAKDHIRAGDIFQVVLSQRLSTIYKGHPFNLYRSLRLINPSPYMSYYQFGDWELIGSSPEVMVKADIRSDGKTEATLRPIAGTRPRGKTNAEDDAYAEDLLADPKEVAEHIMLVDLGRNDLGRDCDKGSDTVDELM
ncbi:MAG: anthranilate synthase component I family protein, partial [Pleurocapsa sp.]